MTATEVQQLLDDAVCAVCILPVGAVGKPVGSGGGGGMPGAALAKIAGSVVTCIPDDDFEAFSDGSALDGLGVRGCPPWTGAFHDGLNYIGVQALDTVESYTSGQALSGLNGGSDWAGAYVDRQADRGSYGEDTMESYTNLAAVNGLNGGTGWPGAYVDR